MPPADPGPPEHAPRRRAPLPLPLGRLLAPLYRFEITRRNRRFDRGRGVTRLPIPVISVGNLSVGGTGKTPMVVHIIAALLRAGAADGSIRPAIAMRGYTRGRPRRGHAPDETDAYRRLFPHVPIVAQPDRIAGVRALLRTPSPPTCVVLDDGFQHRRLARDLDVVLIDASRPPTDDDLLPAGWLREPIESLRRAGLIVLTHAEMLSPAQQATLETRLAAATNRPVDAVARHVWTGLRTTDGDAERQLPLDWLLGRRIAAACAIGNPDGFLHSLRATLRTDPDRPGTLVGAMVLPDHDPFGPEVVAALARLARDGGADAVVVTDKDWSKLRRLPAERFHNLPVVRPELAMVFDRGQDDLDRRVLDAARSGPDRPQTAPPA